ncbi:MULTISPECIES: gephyrin-like molybdotransferase Glp [Arthrobacter]|uniref:Molybdopterin molybdenumtransferase n=2 Tax=Arthrobacter TaxID=1663 RepID=A0ABU9KH93_9MICC|nr:gephyrin-like molybdotransferase Glp [Arthrobacter sp. YJM1]MDP5226251.1 molybdopterin molybdotransferase MoeA [Arthrobacter sp. YJM1]
MSRSPAPSAVPSSRTHGMISVEDHQERILGAAAPLPAVRIPLHDAFGLVLAEDVRRRWALPLFDNSAMDGYAVRRADAVDGARLRVVADLPAGSSDEPALGPGEAARIMTGAPVPADADAVVPLEETEEGTAVSSTPPSHVTVQRQPRPGAHIRRAGEDAAVDSVAVTAGTLLGPWHLSAIASAGHAHIAVHPRPRVAVISTGSELVSPDAEPLRGQIPESNSVHLAAAVREAGADVVFAAIVPDDEAALRRTLESIEADAVILSGGASVGSFDVVKAVLNGMGGVRFDAVAVRPGKPQGFGPLDDGTLAFCLPGNPVAAAVSFELFVRPALRALAGSPQARRPHRTAVAGSAWHSPRHRVQVLPAVLDGDTAHPVPRHAASAPGTPTLAGTDALIVVPAGVEEVHGGDAVTVLPLGGGALR